MTVNWQKTKGRIQSLTDNINTPIDPKIVDTVTSLNILDLKTVASCEGHLDHGLPYPWTDLSPFTDNNPKLKEKRLLIEKRFKTKKPLNQKDTEKLLKIETEIETQIAQYAKKLTSILELFYQTKNTPHSLRIIVINYPEFIRIQPQSGPNQILLSQKEQQKKLKIFQKEFAIFSKFIKQTQLI